MIQRTFALQPAILGILLAAGLSAGTVPSAEEIGARAERMDVDGTAMLRDYVLTRHYVMDVPRFGKHAEMVVRIVHKVGQGKSFDVVELRNAEGWQKKVFDRLIEAERESGKPESLDGMRIGPRNYTFEHAGTEVRDGLMCYVLAMKPKRKSRFLLEGKVWVNADDFGVVHVEGRPSERISFWVGKPQITQSYRKVGPVWMLSSNRSVADVKIVGRSELTFESFDVTVKYQERHQVAQTVAVGARRAGVAE